MRRLSTILSTLIFAFTLWAQSPEKLSYQAVVRNASDQLVINQAVGMQISILQGAANGSAVYVETQTPTSNANGLISIEIGGGVVQSGNFSGITWDSNIYFIKTEVDPAGGSTYTITGTSQLLSVPYALHAKTANTVLSLTGNVSELTNDAGYLTSEADGDATNEIELPAGGSNGQVLKTDGSGNYAWVDQTTDTNTQLDETAVDAFVANNGYLTSEADGDATNEIELPDQSGHNGKYLTTDGSSVSWASVSSSPNITTISANTTLTTSNEIVFINGNYIATFPASPTDGMKLVVCSTSGSAGVNGNGNSIWLAEIEFTGDLTFTAGAVNTYIFFYSSTLDVWLGIY